MIEFGTSSYYRKRGIERQTVDMLRHEAGHMVMARLLGFETGMLIYSSEGAGAQIILDLPLPDIPTLISFIERRVMVLHAGSMAEALKSDGSDGDGEKALELLKGIEGSDDASKTRELLRILTSVTYSEGDFGELLAANGERLWKIAGDIILKHGRNIVMLAKEWRSMVGGRDHLEVSKEQTEKTAEWSAIEKGSEQSSVR